MQLDGHTHVNVSTIATGCSAEKGMGVLVPNQAKLTSTSISQCMVQADRTAQSRPNCKDAPTSDCSCSDLIYNTGTANVTIRLVCEAGTDNSSPHGP